MSEKSKQTTMVLAIVLALAEALFIVAKETGAGPVRKTERSNTEIIERLKGVETIVEPMRGLPRQIGGLEEAVRNLQIGQDRIEDNLNAHVRDKR